MDDINVFFNAATSSINNMVKQFPFEVSMATLSLFLHRCLMVVLMRTEPDAKIHTRRHPFASLFAYVITCFSGMIVADMLLGNAVINVFLDTQAVVFTVLVWFFAYFSPFDVVYKLISSKLALMVLMVVCEFPRQLIISFGVESTIKAYPHASPVQIFLPAVLVGFCKGGVIPFIMKPLDYFLRGSLLKENEFLTLSVPTKNTVVCSVMITLQRMGFLQVQASLLMRSLGAFSAIMNILVFVVGIGDPYGKIYDLLVFQEEMKVDEKRNQKKNTKISKSKHD